MIEQKDWEYGKKNWANREKSYDDDGDGNDDEGFEKIPRAKVDSKEFGVGDVEEDDHRLGTGALEKSVRL